MKKRKGEKKTLGHLPKCVGLTRRWGEGGGGGARLYSLAAAGGSKGRAICLLMAALVGSEREKRKGEENLTHRHRYREKGKGEKKNPLSHLHANPPRNNKGFLAVEKGGEKAPTFSNELWRWGRKRGDHCFTPTQPAIITRLQHSAYHRLAASEEKKKKADHRLLQDLAWTNGEPRSITNFAVMCREKEKRKGKDAAFRHLFSLLIRITLPKRKRGGTRLQFLVAAEKKKKREEGSVSSIS